MAEREAARSPLPAPRAPSPSAAGSAGPLRRQLEGHAHLAAVAQGAAGVREVAGSPLPAPQTPRPRANGGDASGSDQRLPVLYMFWPVMPLQRMPDPSSAPADVGLSGTAGPLEASAAGNGGEQPFETGGCALRATRARRQRRTRARRRFLEQQLERRDGDTGGALPFERQAAQVINTFVHVPEQRPHCPHRCSSEPPMRRQGALAGTYARAASSRSLPEEMLVADTDEAELSSSSEGNGPGDAPLLTGAPSASAWLGPLVLPAVDWVEGFVDGPVSGPREQRHARRAAEDSHAAFVDAPTTPYEERTSKRARPGVAGERLRSDETPCPPTNGHDDADGAGDHTLEFVDGPMVNGTEQRLLPQAPLQSGAAGCTAAAGRRPHIVQGEGAGCTAALGIEHIWEDAGCTAASEVANTLSAGTDYGRPAVFPKEAAGCTAASGDEIESEEAAQDQHFDDGPPTKDAGCTAVSASGRTEPAGTEYKSPANVRLGAAGCTAASGDDDKREEAAHDQLFDNGPSTKDAGCTAVSATGATARAGTDCKSPADLRTGAAGCTAAEGDVIVASGIVENGQRRSSRSFNIDEAKGTDRY